MDSNIELAAEVSSDVHSSGDRVLELGDLQLALVGGGAGDVVFA